jgi:hypothetical protein
VLRTVGRLPVNDHQWRSNPVLTSISARGCLQVIDYAPSDPSPPTDLAALVVGVGGKVRSVACMRM